jgi:hypothetical protein
MWRIAGATLQRHDRALNQRIYIIDCNSDNCGHHFKICGTVNTIYDVHFNHTTLRWCCSCKDYLMNSNGYRPCKHIIYIMRRVLSIPYDNILWSKCQFEIEEAVELSTYFENAHTFIQRIDDEKQERNEQLEHVNKHDDECAICFDNITTDSVFICKICGHNLHSDCWVIWCAHNHRTCPFCRGVN